MTYLNGHFQLTALDFCVYMGVKDTSLYEQYYRASK